MKLVVDNSTVAHRWANQNFEAGESRNPGGNFYYSGKIIYSYGRHFPIARHVTNERGDNAVLFTESTYSNTTRDQVSIVKQACNHLNVIYCSTPTSSHEESFNSWTIDIESIASNLSKARKPEKYLSQIDEIAARVSKYASFFDLHIPEALLAAMAIKDTGEYTDYLLKKIAFNEAEALRIRKEAEARVKKELKKWLAGEGFRLYNRADRDYLRINADKTKVETSQAVVISWELAAKTWEKLKAGKLKVGEKFLREYEVREVGKNVVIGCHSFPVKYLLDFGEKHFTKQLAPAFV